VPRSLRITLATLAACAVLGASVHRGPREAQAFDYVQNGGFEQGTSGWATVGAAAFDAVAGAGIGGSAGGRVVLSGADATLHQPLFPNVPASTYHASAAVRADASGPHVRLQVSTTDSGAGLVDAEAAVTSGGWTTIALDLPLGGAADVRLSLVVSGDAGAMVYIDDVRFDGVDPALVTPTATPTTMPAATASASATRTGSPTRTPSATRTPTPEATATPVAAGPGGGLANGGFEQLDADGRPAGWERYGGSLSAATLPVHSGGRAARFESSTSSTKWLYQTVAVNGGASYSFDAWVDADDPNVASAFLRVSWYASEDGGGGAIGSADSPERLDATHAGYRFLTTGAIAAPADARSARLRVMLAPQSDARAAIYVDDASWGSASMESGGDGTTGFSAASAARTNDVGAARTTRGRSGAGVLALPVASQSSVRINEVLYDPDIDGGDADGEWVELYNGGDTPADVTGWRIGDGVSSEALPSLVVPAHGYAVVAASDSFRDAYPDLPAGLAVVDGRIGNGLGNGGDLLALADASGAVVDAISWGDDKGILDPPIGDVPEGHSIERRTPGADSDAAADFVDNLHPSPGKPYSAPDTQPQRQASGEPTVEVVAGGDTGLRTWLPWLLAAAGIVSGAGALGWRAAPMLVRRRRAQ